MANKTFFVNVRFPEELYKKLHANPNKKASDIVRRAVEEWLAYYSMDEKEIMIGSKQNYILMGRAACGKTGLAMKIAQGMDGRKLIIDPHREYSALGAVKNIGYKGATSLLDEEKSNFLQRHWVEDEAGKVFDAFNASQQNLVLQPDFDDVKIEQMFFSQLFKLFLERKETEHISIIVENGQLYKPCLTSLLAGCIRKNICTLIVSQTPLGREQMLNVSPILGQIGLEDLRDVVPHGISSTANMLKPGEWIWLDSEKNVWNMHREITQKPDNETQTTVTRTDVSQENLSNKSDENQIIEKETSIDKRNVPQTPIKQ